MGRRKNKNKEVEFFDFEIEKQQQQKVKDNMGVSYIKSSEADKCKSNDNINLEVNTPHHNPIQKHTGLKFTNNSNSNSLIDKQDSVFLFVHKYFAKINSYTEIDDLEIILDKDIIEVNDDGFDY